VLTEEKRSRMMITTIDYTDRQSQVEATDATERSRIKSETSEIKEKRNDSLVVTLLKYHLKTLIRANQI
jgi:hypothetical protein